jgi:hypothetical protein
VSYYQRLLAGDHAEAADLIEEHVKDVSVETVYDAIVVPALNYAERDRIEGRLSAEEEQAIVEASGALLEEADGLLGDTAVETLGARPDGPGARMIVLGWPVHGAPDALALRMLRTLLQGTPIVLETLSGSALLADGIRTIKERGCRAVCIADLPPSPSSKSRHLVKRLRAALPELTILVGRWSPPSFADEDIAALKQAGADEVGTTLIETRDQLSRLLERPAPAAPEIDPPLGQVASSRRA